MNSIIDAIIMAFSTYSRIPVPQLEGERAKRGAKAALAAYPVVGIAAAGIELLLYKLCCLLMLSNSLTAIILTLGPVIITGGIHLDGFMDVSDAAASYGERDKKLAIMKDPHVGAFAVINTVIYFLLYYGLAESVIAGMISERSCQVVLLLIYPYERCICAITSLVLKKAKPEGMLSYAAGGSTGFKDKRLIPLFIMFLAITGLLFWGSFYGICVFAVNMLLTAGYYFFTKRSFGGVSGDTAGWLLQMCEIGSLAAIVMAHQIASVLDLGYNYLG